MFRRARPGTRVAQAASERRVSPTPDHRLLAGIVDYDPGDPDIEILGDVSEKQEAGLEKIRATMAGHGGTGVQQSLDETVYGVLDHITAFPVQNESK